MDKAAKTPGTPTSSCPQARLYGPVTASGPPVWCFSVEGFEALFSAFQCLAQTERVRAYKLLLRLVGVTVVWRLSRIGGDPGSREVAAPCGGITRLSRAICLWCVLSLFGIQTAFEPCL